MRTGWMGVFNVQVPTARFGRSLVPVGQSGAHRAGWPGFLAHVRSYKQVFAKRQLFILATAEVLRKGDVERSAKPILESQQPRRLPLDGPLEAHMRCDRTSTVYRRWRKARNLAFGVDPAFGNPQTPLAPTALHCAKTHNLAGQAAGRTVANLAPNQML